VSRPNREKVRRLPCLLQPLQACDRGGASLTTGRSGWRAGRTPIGAAEREQTDLERLRHVARDADGALGSRRRKGLARSPFED
jgi:hypothetical protein